MNGRDRLRAAASRVRQDRRYRLITGAFVSLAVDLCCALYHGLLGILSHSWWMIAMFGYYTVLSTTRFAVVLCHRRSGGKELEGFVLKVVGGLMVLLGMVLCGVIYVSLAEQIAVRYGEIPMITIAAYTFTRLTLAGIGAVKARRERSRLLTAIRCIGYGEAAVSVLTLQRSMLVSFGEMAAGEIRLMNALTGAGVCLFLWALGILMIRKGKNNG